MSFSKMQSNSAAGGTMGVEHSCGQRPSSPPPGTQSSAIETPQPPLCESLLQYADRRRRPIFVLVLVTYLLGFNGQWRLGPDSGLYLNLARSLATGQGYTYHGVRHETVYPGLPLALAGLLRIFPNHFIVAADLMILASALAALALLYRLILLAYDRPTAVIIVCGVAFTNEFFRYSYEILTDMPFLTGVMAVLAGHEAIFGARLGGRGRGRWWDWALLILGLAVAVSTRPTMIGLLIAWVAALGFSVITGNKRFSAAVALTICFAAVAIFLLLDPRRVPGHGLAGSYEQYAFHQLTGNLPHELFAIAPANLRELLVITAPRAVFGADLLFRWSDAFFASVVLIAGVALIRKRLFWGLWIAITLVTLILLISESRYMLQILPLLVLGWWNVMRRVNLGLTRRWGNGLFVLLLLLGTMLNSGRVLVFILHQHVHPFVADFEGGRYQPFVEIARDIPDYTTDQDLILCPDKLARIMTFLADRTFSEPVERRTALPSHHLLAIIDPTNADYMRWLANQNVRQEGDPLLVVLRSGNRPGISLVRMEVAAGHK
jgi:nicotinamide riboside transporter PnuC